MNPLIVFPPAPYKALAFDHIKPEHFLPALEHWIQVAKERQAAIVANSESPTFDNTVVALEFSSLELNKVSSCFFNLNSAETNESIQEIAREFSPKLTAFSSETLLNEPLFLRIQSVYESGQELDTTEEQRLLNETYESFVRNGAALEGEDRTRLTDLNEELSTLSLTFGEHVLAETKAFQYHTEAIEDLQGLPEDVIESAAQLCQ